MSLRKKLVSIVLFALLVVPSVAFAEGFGVYEWSAGGVAMSENYMFAEEDPAVLAYNPAGITRLKGSYFSIGATLVDAHTKNKFNNHPGMEWDNSFSPAGIPTAYYTNQISEKSWVGLAIFPRFGNQIKYDENWPGKFDTVFSGVQGLTIQPTYAWKANDKLSVALGLDICYMGLEMTKYLPTSLISHGAMPDTRLKLEGDSIKVGGVLALQYDFTEDTSAALVYRPQIKHKMDADVYGGSLATALGITQGHGEVTLPDSISFGLGHKFNEGRTRVEFDAVWTNWRTYDSLDVTFNKPVLGMQTVPNPKHWSESWRLGVGIEHKLNKKWSVLGGYVYDESPVADEYMDFTVPTGDRHRFSIGCKFRPRDNREWAFGYSAIIAGDRNVYSHLPGGLNGADFQKAEVYDGLTHIFSISYTMKF